MVGLQPQLTTPVASLGWHRKQRTCSLPPPPHTHTSLTALLTLTSPARSEECCVFPVNPPMAYRCDLLIQDVLNCFAENAILAELQLPLGFSFICLVLNLFCTGMINGRLGALFGNPKLMQFCLVDATCSK